MALIKTFSESPTRLPQGTIFRIVKAEISLDEGRVLIVAFAADGFRIGGYRFVDLATGDMWRGYGDESPTWTVEVLRDPRCAGQPVMF